MKVAAIVLTVAVGRLALAAPTTDDVLAHAEAAAKSGDFLGAAAQFKLAYAQDPRPELICNVGVAYYKAKQLPRAQLFLNRCLERGTALDATFVDSVRTVLKSVESALRAGSFTPIDIVVEPAGATVVVQAFGDDEAFIGSRVVWLARGPQTLVARAEGYVAQTVAIDAAGTSLQPVKITLQRAPTDAPPIATTTSPRGDRAAGAAAVAGEPPAATSAQVEHPSKVPAIVASTVAVGSFALAVLGYQRAHDRAELAAFALTQNAYDDDASAVGRWNTLMVTGTVVGVASAGLAGYLWSRAFRSPAVELHATGSSIAISGRW